CDKTFGNGCEVDGAKDAKNCGACGKACAAVMNGVAGCAGGVCGIASCNGSFRDCDMNAADGCEIDTSGDASNCGACGKVCPAELNGMAGCAHGVCGIGVCNPGFRDCNASAADGCEKNINTDLANCGSCGNVCAVKNDTPSCTNGICGIASCNAG